LQAASRLWPVQGFNLCSSNSTGLALQATYRMIPTCTHLGLLFGWWWRVE